MFRRECFEDIGGYVPIKTGGVDLVAVITARMKGWQTRSFLEKSCEHHRKMGTANHNTFAAAFARGRTDYTHGCDVVWELFRSCYQMTRRPVVIGGSLCLAGYVWGMMHANKVVSEELVQFRKAEQRRRLMRFFRDVLTGEIDGATRAVIGTGGPKQGYERIAVTELRAISTDIRWHAGLPIYASEPFLKAVGDEYGWIGGVDGSGRLRCILPYTVIRKPGFRIVRFRVETVPLGEQLSELEEKSFLNSTVEYFRADGADLIIPGTNAAVFQTYPDGAVAAPYGTFIKDLTQSEETLLKEVHETYRYNIRRAIKGGAAVMCGMEHLQTAYEGANFVDFEKIGSRIQEI